MFKTKEYMSYEQQSLAEDFTNMIESEYSLCVREINRANQSIVDISRNTTSEENSKKIDWANREIDSIRKYWNSRLSSLVEFLAVKDPKLNKELAKKYLNHD